MQLVSIGSDDMQPGKAMKRAMILLAAASAAAAVGLATIDMPEANLTPSGLQTDASAGGRAGVVDHRGSGGASTVSTRPRASAHESR